MVAGEAGVWDNYSVKKQLLHSWSVLEITRSCSLLLCHSFKKSNNLSYSTVIASNILLVDEILRAGMSSLKG